MEPSSLVKVVAAFVAGVVIALGSALIYVRVSDMIHPPTAAVAQAATDVSQPEATQLPDLAKQSPVDQASEPAAPPPHQEQGPAQVPAPVQPKKPKTNVITHQHAAVAAPRRNEAKIPMARLAQNRVPDARPPDNERVVYPSPQAASQAAPEPLPPADDPPPAPAPDAEPIQQPHVVTLQAGTVIPVHLAETVSTDHNYTGDTFRGTLESAIISDGFIIADRGSKVLGRVVSSERAGRMGGEAELNLTLTEINTTDGQRIRLDTGSLDRRGPSNAGEDAAKIAGGAALGAIIGAAAGGGKGAAIGAGIGGAAGTGAVLVTRGKAASFPVESRITFRLATPLTITEKLNH